MSLVLVDTPEPHVTVLRLNRPDVLNAMSFELMTELRATLEDVGQDNACWVVVLTGAGRGFCSGLDLDGPGAIPGVEEMAMSRVGMAAMSAFSQIVPAVRAVPQPVIAAVNGPAYGGGMCLSLSGDVRIAGASAEFNSTGIVNGLTSTELGASWLLPRIVGVSYANDMMLTGRTIGAVEAERIGLVSRVVPDEALLDEAVAIAAGMTKFSPFGLQMTKRVCWANLETASLTAAIDIEDRNQLILGYTENLMECITARKEGRAPVYTDEPMQGTPAYADAAAPLTVPVPHPPS